MGVTTQTYDVLTRIAIGNGSLVYRAVHKATLRQVALKLLTQDGDLDHRLDVPALFATTPQICQITGSHVCQLLDAYEDEDGPLLVYEFANGMNGAELPLQRKLDAAQALDVAAQIISALRSGERQRTPHGDLKPSNLVFVDMPDGRPFVLVLDWGLAAFRVEPTPDSLPYLAPERLRGGPVSHSADLFAAGSVLFYLLTGKVLALGANREELLQGWAKARPEILSELRPDLPPKLVQWICSLVSLDPANRPASAVDAGTALNALNPPPPMVAPESIRPRPPTASQRAAASGISAPPQSSAPRPVASAARPAPARAPVASAVPATPAAARPPQKKSSAVLVTIALMIVTIAGGGAAWWFTRDKDGSGGVVGPATDRASRTPSPSVTAPVATPEPRALPDRVAKGKPAASAPPAAPTASAGPAVDPDDDDKKSDDGPLLANESFSYPDGTEVSAAKDGSGWAEGWKGAGARVDAKSIAYPDHPANGGSLLLPESRQDSNVGRTVGPFSQVIKDPSRGGYCYFAVLLEHSDGTPAAGGDFQIVPFENSKGDSPVFITVTENGLGLQISMPGATEKAQVPDADQPVLLIGRVEWSRPSNGRADVKTSLLVNPPMTSLDFKGGGNPIVSTVRSVPMSSKVRLNFRKKAGRATTRLDEIRYAKHWAEVTYKPKSAGEPKAAIR